MIQIGFIGYGSMGSMLLQGFIKSGVITPEEIIISTRTKSKLEDIKNKYPGINTANNNSDAAKNAKYIFVCVEPLTVKEVLAEIKDSLSSESVIISIAGTVSIKNIVDLTRTKVVKLIPSLTSEVSEGISLVCYNEQITDEEATYIEALLNGISRVKRIKEDDFGLATELTSCAPGFFAAILDEFVQSALRQNSALSQKDIEDMVIQTFYGTAKVLTEQHMSFSEMVRRVATKGGITEEGVKVFNAELPETFDKMFEVTLNKH
jgi:pyrroline-5-carboxylate reductase